MVIFFMLVIPEFRNQHKAIFLSPPLFSPTGILRLCSASCIYGPYDVSIIKTRSGIFYYLIHMNIQISSALPFILVRIFYLRLYLAFSLFLKIWLTWSIPIFGEMFFEELPFISLQYPSSHFFHIFFIHIF